MPTITALWGGPGKSAWAALDSKRLPPCSPASLDRGDAVARYQLDEEALYIPKALSAVGYPPPTHEIT